MQLLISAVTWEKELRSTMKQVELIPLAKELGCSGVEFRPFWKNEEEEIPEIQKALIENNIIGTYASNEGLLADSEEETYKVLDSLSANVKIAHSLGSSILRFNVSSGSFNPEFIKSSWWQEGIKKVLALAESLHITLVVENAPDAKKGDLNFLVQLLTTVNSPILRLTYDTGNWLYANTKPEEALSVIEPYIGYVHLKDIVIDQGTLKHSYLGTGIVDVKGIAQGIAASGYKGPFALEFPGGDNPIERVRNSQEYISK